MAYSSLIKETRALSIANDLMETVRTAERQADFINLANFAEVGNACIGECTLEILEEINLVNTFHAKPIRFALDDKLRLRDYFEQFVPTLQQLEVISHYGIEKLKAYLKK